MNVSEIWSLLKHPRRNWKFLLSFFLACMARNNEASQKELKDGRPEIPQRIPYQVEASQKELKGSI